jgi:hypothetical protein
VDYRKDLDSILLNFVDDAVSSDNHLSELIIWKFGYDPSG